MQPGYKSKSFWGLLVATALTALMGSDALPGGAMASGVGMLLAALGASGYASVRAFAKGKDGKKAWKTTEFWLSLAAVAVSGLMASGLMGDGSTLAKAVGLVSTLLAAGGYTARFALPPKNSLLAGRPVAPVAKVGKKKLE